jgi:hypothetical protein
MYKIAALLAMWLALSPAWSPQNEAILDCYQRCRVSPTAGDPEMQRQELVTLEREAAHAIQLGDTTFFRRVYSDDFAGTLSHGESVDKTSYINAVQSSAIKYEAFNASDIKIRIYRDTAVATCMWSSRGVAKGQSLSSQMRVMHIYVNGGSGWKVVAGQQSALPPYPPQPL